MKNSKLYDTTQYIFSTIIENDRFTAEIMINFTNPLDGNLEKLLINNRSTIDAVINAYYEESINVAKIVFNLIDSETINHEYSLFEDGTPFNINDITAFGASLAEIKEEIEKTI